MPPCSMSVDSPHTPAVGWKRQLHRGTTETWPYSTGFENTGVATGPSLIKYQPRPWHQLVGILDSSACLPLLEGRAWPRASPKGTAPRTPWHPQGAEHGARRGRRPAAKGLELCSLCRITRHLTRRYHSIGLRVMMYSILEIQRERVVGGIDNQKFLSVDCIGL